MIRLCLSLTLLAALLMFLRTAGAAEIVINGERFQSHTFVSEFTCDGYSVLIKENRFPYKLEHEIERNALEVLPGFLGDSVTVSATASIVKDGIEHSVPDVSKEYQRTGRMLNDGRVYLPGLPYCEDKHTFLLTYWSGGNCIQCEVYVRYEIGSAGSIVGVGDPTNNERQKFIYNVPLPQEIKH